MSVHEDEQLARDMQMALNLQAKEEDEEDKRRKRATRHTNAIEKDGFADAESLNRADHMLYVLCEVDGRAVEMLVDSGASNSVISSEMVTRLDLRHKLNSSIEGAAMGVGSAKILGLLENVKCIIGHVEFRLFFMVLEASAPFLILGLDQLRRFRCCLDLEKDTLTFGGSDGVPVPFLTRELASQAAMTTYMTKQQNEATAAAVAQQQAVRTQRPSPRKRSSRSPHTSPHAPRQQQQQQPRQQQQHSRQQPQQQPRQQRQSQTIVFRARSRSRSPQRRPSRASSANNVMQRQRQPPKNSPSPRPRPSRASSAKVLRSARNGGSSIQESVSSSKPSRKARRYD